MSVCPPFSPLAASSPEALQGIIEAAPVAMLVSDRKGIIHLANAEARRLLGYAENELPGMPVEALLPSQYHEQLQAFLTRFHREPESVPASAGPEFCLRRKDGSEAWVQMGFNPVRINGVVFAVGAMINLDERRSGEQALRESEEKFAKAFRSSPDAISVHEMATGRYLDANPGVLGFFGCTREEIIGRTPTDLGFWADLAERDAFIGLLRREGAVRDFAATFRTRHGGIRRAELSAEMADIGGRPHNVTVLRDITERLAAEQALRESEEKFAKAFRASPDPIALTDLETGRYLDANGGHEQVFGFTREEVIGRTTLELGYYSNPDDRLKLVEEIRAHGRVRNLELDCLNRWREPIKVLLSSEAIEINGRPCLVSVVHDITARHRAEAALRESEEKFAKAFRASPDAISISELATGRILEVNEGFERLSGYSRAELVGHTSDEMGFWVTSGDRARMLDELRRNGRVRNMEVQARSRTGKLRDYLMSAETFEFGGQSCLVIASHDITEQKGAAQALRESEEKFAAAFRSSPYSLTISDLATGRYVDVNEGFERLSGYSRAEVLGRTSMELGFWANPADRDELVRRLRARVEVRSVETEFIGRGGQRMHARCSCQAIDLGGVPCILTVLEDTTAQRQAEKEKTLLEAQLKQSQKLEALGTLAGGIAHDFNNILSAMIVYRELAVMDIDRPAELRKHLAEIGAASNRAKELVRQILTFSRQQQQERRPVELHPVVREALRLLRASLPATIEIVTAIDEQAPQVLADTSQVHQIMMNLGTNAAHAMRDQPGRLTVTLRAQQMDAEQAGLHPGLRPGPYVQLSVADTGRGMDDATLARIFEPFFTTKGPGEGTGLGLSVVHGIMEDHDGAIVVRSRPGLGTTFDLYFPRYAGIAIGALDQEQGIPRGSGESVLVIDDESPLCEAMRVTLQKLGYRVTAFTNPVEAVGRFRAAPQEFDLVVTDHTMPRMTGLDVIHELHRLRPRLPALLVSGLSGTWTADKLRGFSIRELVAKPIDFAGLARAVRRALDSRSMPVS